MNHKGYEMLKLVGDLDSLLIIEAAEPLSPTPTKKHLARRILQIAATLCMIGCLAVAMPGLWKWVQEPPADPTDNAKEPLYSGSSLEDFLAYWQESHTVIVPTPRSDDYVLVGVTESENNYIYTFYPADGEEYPFHRAIRIYCSKENGATVEGVTKQFDLTFRNGRAYSERACTWFIDCHEGLISIAFPRTEGTIPFSRVTDLFSFSVYTADGEVCPLFE